jgi:hypothetical protein
MEFHALIVMCVSYSYMHYFYLLYLVAHVHLRLLNLFVFYFNPYTWNFSCPSFYFPFKVLLFLLYMI